MIANHNTCWKLEPMSLINMIIPKSKEIPLLAIKAVRNPNLNTSWSVDNIINKNKNITIINPNEKYPSVNVFALEIKFGAISVVPLINELFT